LRKRVRLVAEHLLKSFLDEKEILRVTAPLLVPVIERKLAAKVASALDAARDKVDSSSAR